VCKSTTFYLKSKGFYLLSDKIEMNKHILYDKTQTNVRFARVKTERNKYGFIDFAAYNPHPEEISAQDRSPLDLWSLCH